MSNQASTTTEGKTPGSVTLREVTDDYLEHLAASGARPSTVQVYSLCRARHNLYYAGSRIMPSGNRRIGSRW